MSDDAGRVRPERLARAIDPGPEDGLGVQRDTLLEAAIDADDAAYRLRQTYVACDAIADEPMPGVASEVRTLQEKAQDLAEWYEGLADAFRERHDAVVEEMR